MKKRETKHNWLAYNNFTQEASERKTRVRTEYGERLTEKSKSEEVLCVFLETERVVSGRERCETEMGKQTKKKRIETMRTGFNKQQLDTPELACPCEEKHTKSKAQFLTPRIWSDTLPILAGQWLRSSGGGCVRATTTTSNFQSEQMCFNPIPTGGGGGGGGGGHIVQTQKSFLCLLFKVFVVDLVAGASKRLRQKGKKSLPSQFN